MNADCIFCKIANGEIPSKTIYEDADFRVILDIAPGTPADRASFSCAYYSAFRDGRKYCLLEPFRIC